ncbi:Protein of unknown function [Loktanella sp. DSM 29012]|uniref:DUF1523 family protein n=1 Tax=Loktanella sp. DSM 29012 TaxID=1881056 RepID=UPI0008BEB8C5|nr:DUF1523 family protein [Loktanella sp. DSM 29012]SEQ42320.1 Protein of unknown function [Loktanella sp. DSM 29012]
MRAIFFFLRLLPILILGGFLHYVLPQHDTVQITSTEVIRTDFSNLNRIFYAQADNGGVEQATRDLRLINTTKVRTYLLGFIPTDRTEVMVYRNEDTGWIWPPYFKFDSADLQAEASAAARADGWYSITHYGWRNRWLSIYPNAVRITPVDGPNPGIVPWFNIFFFSFLFVAFFVVRGMWRQFRERMIDPSIDAAEHQFDEARAGLAQRRSGLRRWLDSWKSKDRQ